MLLQSTQCDADRLRRLLNAQLSEQDEACVTAHVESCENCRIKLEALAADAEWWRETHELLAGQSDTNRRIINLSGSNQIANAYTETLDPPSLAFLAPSDNPAMLGRLGEFEVLEFIGRGGMGLVLKGYDHELNRFVAIKVLGPHYAEHAAARRRFAREAQAAAAVVHPHVVAIHAVDASYQPPYFVMAFVPGESLQQRLDRTGPFEITEVLRIGQQVAEGLAAAHAQGLVHRDIKPANILLERNVELVLLTDFGLARAIDDASLTQSGVISGTPQYMSPEQARGEAIDPRTDLFSLGCVLYSLLTGHSPFRANSPYAVIRRVNEDIPRPMREINPDVPEWMEAFIARLLAKQPEARWQTAKEVAELLKACLAHLQQPIGVPLPSQLIGLTPRRRSHRLRWTLITSLIVTLFVVSSFQFLNPNRNATPAVEREIEDASTAIPITESPVLVPTQQDKWDDPLLDEAHHVDELLQVLESAPEF